MEQKEEHKPNIETEEQLKEKTKKLSILEGSAFSVMDGAGLRNITPYALALGASNSQIGFLTSIPTLLGNLSQILIPKSMEKYSRKKILIVNVFLQALMWLPLLLIGYLFFYKGLSSGKSSILVILFYTLLLFFGALISPVWNSLIKDVVTHKSGNYFGRRSKILGAVALIALLISGFVLDYFQGKQILFFGFLILFGFAFIARMTSSYLFTKHHEPELKLEEGYYFTLKQFIKKIPESNFGKFSVFVALIMLATSIASPFFSVYMLKELKFSYTIWTLIVIASSLGSLLFMQLWGRFADKFGNLKVVEITGMYIPFVPLVWLLSPLIAKFNPSLLIVYLFAFEFISGIMWAGFNLSSVNFIYDVATRQRIALCIAYFNILNGIGVFIGASLGGLISSVNFTFFGLSPLLFIFLLSFVIRFGAYIFMISRIKEVREVEKYEHRALRKQFRDRIMYISNKFIQPRPT